MAEVHIQAVSTAQAVADSPVEDSPVEEDSTAPAAAAVTIVPEVTAVRAVAAGPAIIIPAALMTVTDAFLYWRLSSAFSSAAVYILLVPLSNTGP